MNCNPGILNKCAHLLYLNLDNRRLLHTLGTLITGLELAELYSADLFSVCITALCHDIGRNITPELIKQRLVDSAEPIPEEDKPFPQLWHCNYAALVLKSELGIAQPELLQAVLWHSTGEAEMTTLQKIIFLADYIEPTRNFEGVTELKRLATIDLDRALALALKMKLNYLRAKGGNIHPRLIRAYNFYVEKAD